MNDETFTMTLAVSLDPTREVPFEFDLRVGSNTQWDFVKYAPLLHLLISFPSSTVSHSLHYHFLKLQFCALFS
jgi:hypothetical protein